MPAIGFASTESKTMYLYDKDGDYLGTVRVMRDPVDAAHDWLVPPGASDTPPVDTDMTKLQKAIQTHPEAAEKAELLQFMYLHFTLMDKPARATAMKTKYQKLMGSLA